ncbi:MAG: type II secretion system F family protein, partial [Candidatus Hydrogenedentes bacterium]|nr:type II secretion system F family protein [Candidatus Hydrogenedentota bacterium]
MAHLCYRLSSLTKGGVPIVRTLQLLVDGPHAKPYRAIFLPVIDSLRTGDTLGEALRTQSRYLPGLFIETVVAGELSGKLDVVL